MMWHYSAVIAFGNYAREGCKSEAEVLGLAAACQHMTDSDEPTVDVTKVVRAAQNLGIERTKKGSGCR